MEKQIQKAKSVIKIFFFNIVIILFVGCNSSKLIDSKNENYEIKYLKTKNNLSSYIVINFFDSDNLNKKINASVNINGISLNRVYEFKVLSGSYNVRGSFVGKKHVLINNLKISKGDSIVLKAFMQDSDEPIY